MASKLKLFKNEEKGYTQTSVLTEEERKAQNKAAKKAQIEAAAAETKGVLKSKKVFKLAVITILIASLIAGIAMFVGCTPKENNPGGGDTPIVTPVDPPHVDPPIDNGGGTGDENTPSIDPNQNQNNENQGGEIDNGNGQENQGGEIDNGNGGQENQGGEQTQETYVDFESFMSQRETIADTIVDTNKDGILQLLVGENAENYDIADYSLNVNQKDANDDCNEISSAKMTVVLQNKTSNMQRVAVLNVDFGQTLTETNQNSLVEDCTITKVTSIATRSTDSADVELKTALAEAFLAETGININYTADDIHLYKGGTSVSQTYGSTNKYTLVISNDEGFVQLSGKVKSSSNIFAEIQANNMDDVEGEQIEDFHTLAEHQTENEHA